MGTYGFAKVRGPRFVRMQGSGNMTLHKCGSMNKTLMGGCIRQRWSRNMKLQSMYLLRNMTPQGTHGCARVYGPRNKTLQGAQWFVIMHTSRNMTLHRTNGT